MRRAIGHIAERTKGSFSIKVSLGKDTATGNYKYKWVTVRGSRRDAEKKLSEIINQIEKGAYTLPTKKRISEYLTDWLASYSHNLAPRTVEVAPICPLQLYEMRAHHIMELGRIWCLVEERYDGTIGDL